MAKHTLLNGSIPIKKVSKNDKWFGTIIQGVGISPFLKPEASILVKGFIMESHALPYTHTNNRIILTVSVCQNNLKKINAKGDIKMPIIVVIINRGKTVRFVSTIQIFFTTGI